MQKTVESLGRRLEMKDGKHKEEITESVKLTKEYEEKLVEVMKQCGELSIQRSELSAQHSQLSADFESLKKQHLEAKKLQMDAAHSLNAKMHQLEELQNELAIVKAQVSWLYTLTFDSCVTVYTHHNRLPCTRRTLNKRGKTEKQ